ncbi:cyclopropane fatty acyl phospholipid synthase [Bdellovibrio svalbardensis]|uniref:Cyclopropane fatty acyl phospholipid synthase n=1 Tax=Bdellovibrio svalbardensis TaxID=2972972 RepID=A0ABT6DIQ4_9BACT|nr:cyclopropane fatty acyl phospholipid synthase [Bdellovibrio svalbardensis]MDG0815809.1 cyclopropane fatty acyl phospholipid synthase [Bdellovibrio svalbardensis]
MNIETLSRIDSQDFLSEILGRAGIVVNGTACSDIKVHNPRFYNRVLAQGSLGLGDSYVEGWWDCDDLSQFFFLLLRAKLDEEVNPALFLLQSLKSKVLNLSSRNDPFLIGEFHYDLGDDLYKAMLDEKMIYTCGYWKDAKNLEEAQERKLQLVCDKLSIQPGMRVLDIGCGWGGFLKYCAEKYQVQGVGVTVSEEQAVVARKNCQGLDVEILLQDYREVTGKFDRIVSLGMFEHVGKRSYQTFFEKAADCLTDDGLFLLHTIGGNKSSSGTDPWIERHIFPNSMLPSIAQIGQSIEDVFVMEDWHNFGVDYDKTLLAWYENFDRNWPALSGKYEKTFYRKWKYYLLCCAGSFRARSNQLWQIVLSKNGVLEGYKGIR